MPEVGRLAVCLALLFAAYGVLAGGAGGLRRRAHVVRSAGHAAFVPSLLVVVTDPFERLPVAAREGADLNPLLQNYWMMIHPPSLYTGYVSASVPFAFAIAALATGQLGDQWARSVRRWALFSWA